MGHKYFFTQRNAIFDSDSVLPCTAALFIEDKSINRASQVQLLAIFLQYEYFSSEHFFTSDMKTTLFNYQAI